MHLQLVKQSVSIIFLLSLVSLWGRGDAAQKVTIAHLVKNRFVCFVFFFPLRNSNSQLSFSTCLYKKTHFLCLGKKLIFPSYCKTGDVSLNHYFHCYFNYPSNTLLINHYTFPPFTGQVRMSG